MVELNVLAARMDDLDLALISMLRQDARRPVSELAGALGVARATVRARLERLIASGAIAGFTVVLASELRSHAVQAIMLIEVEGRAAEDVVARLRGMPEVLAIHTTNGRWDLVAEIGAGDLPGFDAILRRIRQVAGITVTETNILLATRKRIGDARRG